NELPIGGGKGILNAASTNWGPSWRMIVMLGDDKVEAFGIYPGGQSGNPGSRYYANFVDKWAAGEYNRLSFWAEDQTIPQSEILWVQDFE
ncbi:MAG TPA: penicillin acylase family protein, partial [Chitinophagales bacterium]|nr:penicillin acylase family protein [Chitinophagales bacterium]